MHLKVLLNKKKPVGVFKSLLKSNLWQNQYIKSYKLEISCYGNYNNLLVIKS